MDNLELMKQLPKGKIDLIYIDPPFGIKTDEKFGMIPWNKNNQNKNEVDIIFPTLEKILTKGECNYLRWIYPRLALMRELLSEKGSIYVHTDWHLDSYIKLILDNIFGKDRLINEIIWSYQGTGTPAKGFKHKHDTIYFYSKSDNLIFNEVAAGEQFGKKQKVKYTNFDKHKQQYYKEYRHPDGQVYRQYWNDNKFMRLRDVWEISTIQSWNEKLDYPTQKPEALLERIIKISSNENSVVADFFAGSGTTCAVAKKLNRYYIGCDINKKAIDITKKRLNDEIHS